MLSLLFASLAATGVVVILLAAWMLAQRRSAEFTVLRARGGTVRQLAVRTLRGTVAVCVPAALVAAALGILVTPGEPAPASWWLAGLALVTAILGPPLAVAWQHRVVRPEHPGHAARSGRPDAGPARPPGPPPGGRAGAVRGRRGRPGRAARAGLHRWGRDAWRRAWTCTPAWRRYWWRCPPCCWPCGCARSRCAACSGCPPAAAARSASSAWPRPRAPRRPPSCRCSPWCWRSPWPRSPACSGTRSAGARPPPRGGRPGPTRCSTPSCPAPPSARPRSAPRRPCPASSTPPPVQVTRWVLPGHGQLSVVAVDPASYPALLASTPWPALRHGQLAVLAGPRPGPGQPVPVLASPAAAAALRGSPGKLSALPGHDQRRPADRAGRRAGSRAPRRCPAAARSSCCRCAPRRAARPPPRPRPTCCC